MDVVHVVQGITFTWDRRKALTNLRKHGVSFESASEAFFDPFVQGVREQETNGERREVVIGMTTSWQLVVVAFALRGEVIRMISARRTTPSERKRYEDR